MTSFQDSKPGEKQISQLVSYCELINLPRNGTIVRCLWENKKMSEQSVFREAQSPEMMSQLFLVSCFWFCGFVPHRKWNLTLLVHQNTGKENCYRANNEKSVIYTLRVNWNIFFFILLCSMVQVLMLWTCGNLLLFMRQLPKQGEYYCSSATFSCKKGLTFHVDDFSQFFQTVSLIVLTLGFKCKLIPQL